MIFPWRRLPVQGVLILVCTLVLATGSLGSAWGQTPESSPSGQQGVLSGGQEPPKAPLLPPSKEKVTPVQTEKIDQAAQRIGANIDRMSEKASRSLGKWVDAKVFYGISWLKLMVCAGLLFLVVFFERVVRALLHRRLQSLEAAGEKEGWLCLALETLHRPLTLFIWVYGVYGALSPLFGHFQAPDGSNLVHTVASKAADVGGTIVLIWVIYRLVAVVDLRLKQRASTTESTIDDMLVPLVGRSLRIFVAAVGAIMVLQTLTGIDVGPLIASLGIGGLALALAAKESVANFFGTLTILFDKPFQVGERILVDGYDGVVESVGFRSIRLRTLTGHLVAVPNEKVVNSPIENVGKRPHIRWLTNITLTYDTPPEKVERAVEIIRTILENHEGMHPDFPPRVYFNGFNDWSLNIMIIAWYHPPNYWDYQEWLQKTCLAIMRALDEEGIEFAFPTRTLYLANDDRRQLKLQMLRGKSS
ncbi:MscS family membrane protein [Desulfacinum hydrothermale DSM 13146]|uniref:MscS family membrane protein n=1 Tax=Desulfacinum hydrothermale DSM 13146 TaxID=1121390 RepID=A0A1W1XLK5_9BACT|nr:mechanosensitive ion channel family protein [Desulfacinum hydrothermale]SMC24431.1 MscS family membrane protein [Desulfacinum hydrothermale DSM 13146]